jgi:hypothetical protein
MKFGQVSTRGLLKRSSAVAKYSKSAWSGTVGGVRHFLDRQISLDVGPHGVRILSFALDCAGGSPLRLALFGAKGPALHNAKYSGYFWTALGRSSQYG